MAFHNANVKDIMKTKTAAPKDFETPAMGKSTLTSFFPRADSMEVTNDPRMFGANVLATRMNAFHVMAVCSVLLANLSCGQMMGNEDDEFPLTIRGVGKYFAFFTGAVVFIMNLSAAIIIIQQLFHMTRLATAGPTGFEISRSYYLNPNVLKLRHMGARLFFISLPTYLFCIGLTVYIKGGGRKNLPVTVPILVVLWSGTLAITLISNKQTSIFAEKYAMCHAHENPLRDHLMETSVASFQDPHNIL